MLRKLTAQPPDVKQWEVGGNCNFLIAAARLGLSVASIGNLGSDIYGDFVRRILKVMGIPDAVSARNPPWTSYVRRRRARGRGREACVSGRRTHGHGCRPRGSGRRAHGHGLGPRGCGRSHTGIGVDHVGVA